MHANRWQKSSPEKVEHRRDSIAVEVLPGKDSV